MQDLTDLDAELPDYLQKVYPYGNGDTGLAETVKGAPVDEERRIRSIHSVPETYEAALNDGEALAMVRSNRSPWSSKTTRGPPIASSSQFAQFLRSQFGVQTMQQWGIVLPRYGDGREDDEDESGPYAVHTLER